MTDFTVQPLSPLFGAEVIGLNLYNSQAATIAALYEVIHQYKLVVIRDQELTPEQQIAACARFGEIEPHSGEWVPWGHRELTYVSNTDMARTQVLPHSGPPFELWHSDTCYLPRPARISLLYAECVPQKAGETLFADTISAYNDLPPEWQARLERKRALFGSGAKLMERCHKRGYMIDIPVSRAWGAMEQPTDLRILNRT